MSDVDLSIIIPTVTGRERYLDQCVASYDTHTVGTFEIIIVTDQPGIAYAWQRGAEAAAGKYIHMTNDDCEATPNWNVAATKLTDDGFQPVPRLLNSDGTPWTNAPADRDPWTLPDRAPATMSSLPFILRDWWQHITPLPPGMHYFTDNWISWRLELAGIKSAICHGYDLKHHWAQEHRGAGWTEPQRMQIDQVYADMAVKIVMGATLALQQQPGWDLVNGEP